MQTFTCIIKFRSIIILIIIQLVLLLSAKEPFSVRVRD